eukprot:2822247-Rhodomonas_salina.1
MQAATELPEAATVCWQRQTQKECTGAERVQRQRQKECRNRGRKRQRQKECKKQQEGERGSVDGHRGPAHAQKTKRQKQCKSSAKAVQKQCKS